MPGPDVDYLYEDSNSGQLRIDPNTGKAFRSSGEADKPSPSLSGPSSPSDMGFAKGTGFTAIPSRGLGGSSTGAPKSVSASYTAAPQSPRQMTPEELLAAADEQQKAFEAATEDARNPNGGFLSSLATGSRAPKEGPPEWLTDYMSRQPFTDPYHQVGPSRVDIIKNNKYLSEQEKLKMLKDLKDKS